MGKLSVIGLSFLEFFITYAATIDTELKYLTAWNGIGIGKVFSVFDT